MRAPRLLAVACAVVPSLAGAGLRNVGNATETSPLARNRPPSIVLTPRGTVIRGAGSRVRLWPEVFDADGDAAGVEWRLDERLVESRGTDGSLVVRVPYTLGEWRIRACVVARAQETCDEVLLTNAVPDTRAPEPPQDLRSAGETASSILLSWIPPEDEAAPVDAILVFRCEAPPIGPHVLVRVATLKADDDHWTDHDVRPGTRYEYSLRAIGPGGESGDSGHVFTSTSAVAPRPPSLFPNIRFDGIVYPADGNVESNGIPLTVTIVNDGRAATTTAPRVDIYESLGDEVLDAGDRSLQSITFDDLDIGARSTELRFVDPPEDPVEGMVVHYVFVIDPRSRITESDERDNSAVVSVPLRTFDPVTVACDAAAPSTLVCSWEPGIYETFRVYVVGLGRFCDGTSATECTIAGIDEPVLVQVSARDDETATRVVGPVAMAFPFGTPRPAPVTIGEVALSAARVAPGGVLSVSRHVDRHDDPFLPLAVHERIELVAGGESRIVHDAETIVSGADASRTTDVVVPDGMAEGPAVVSVTIAPVTAASLDGPADEIAVAVTVARPDADADGVADSDNCPDVPNPDQRDRDADGIGDACDGCVTVPDPWQADLDANGLPDACELAWGDIAPVPSTDGVVTIGDAVRALRISVGLETPPPDIIVRADVAPAVRRDGLLTPTLERPWTVDVADIVLLLRATLGLERFERPW